MEDLLTPTAVRKYLSISRTMLYTLVRNKDLPVTRLSKNGKGRMRFKREDLERFVNDREEKV